MKDWLIQDVLKSVVPRAVAVLVAYGIAHTQTLAKWGLNVDWATLGGKLTAALAVLIGLLTAHHTEKLIKGGTQ